MSASVVMMDTDPPDYAVVDIVESEGPDNSSRDILPGTPASPWVSLPETDTKWGPHHELLQVAVLVTREPIIGLRVPRVLSITCGDIWKRVYLIF